LESDRDRDGVAAVDGEGETAHLGCDEDRRGRDEAGDAQLAWPLVVDDEVAVDELAQADLTEVSGVGDDQVGLGLRGDARDSHDVGACGVVAEDRDRARLGAVGWWLKANDNVDRIARVDKQRVGKDARRQEIRRSRDAGYQQRARAGIVDREQFVDKRAEADVSEAAGIGDRCREFWRPRRPGYVDNPGTCRVIPEARGRFDGKPRSPYRIDPFLQKTEVLPALFGGRLLALSLGSGDVRESNLEVREIDLDSQRRRPVVSAHRWGLAHVYGLAAEQFLADPDRYTYFVPGRIPGSWNCPPQIAWSDTRRVVDCDQGKVRAQKWTDAANEVRHDGPSGCDRLTFQAQSARPYECVVNLPVRWSDHPSRAPCQDRSP